MTHKFVDLVSERCVHFLHRMETLARKGLIPRLATLLLENKIYAMQQSLRQRYNGTVAMITAVFWLLLYVVVNLTSILYLGGLAVH